jgi:Major tropism determinant N-terminal domain
MTTYANVGHILLKRGNTAQSTGYTGPIGELTFDTDLGTVRVHNGSSAGGVSVLATKAQIDTLSNSISTITGIDSEFVANINSLLANAVSQQSNITDISSTLVDVETAVAAIFDGTARFGNLIPGANVIYDLGSPDLQWGNLYVSSDTIYIAGIPLRVDIGGNLTINGNSVGGGTLSGSQLFNGEFTATLDNEGHLIANRFIAGQGTDNGTGYSFYNDGGFDTGMFSAADGTLEFHNNATQSATVDDQGNWAFNNPVDISNVYNLSGVVVQNADLTHGATSAVIVPANGTSDPLQVNNFYGTVNITSGVNLSNTKVWTFGTDGQVATPQGGHLGDTYSDGHGIGLSAGPGEGDYAVINSHSGAQYVEASETAVYIGTNYPTTNTIWTFNKEGKLTFPDGTVQTTAYVNNNVNMDGGGAGTVYEVETAYADGGFASIRSFNETFDGSNGNNYILDGGRA